MVEEEVLWEGKIRLVRVKVKENEEALRWDDEELYNGLDVLAKRLKHEVGENLTNAIFFGLIGMMERWKIHVMFLTEEVK